jgi:hypothetical protein
MAKARVDRSRITIEIDPKVKEFFEGLAQDEGRGLSNLLRRLLTGIADKRMAARAGLTEIEQHIR